METDKANQGVPRAIEGLDLTQALENVCGNSEFLRTVLITFYNIHKRDLDKIRHCHTAGDMDSLHRIAHGLKGLSGTLAAEALHTSSRALDTHVRSRDLEQLPGLIDRVEADLAPTLTSIKKNLIDNIDQVSCEYH